MKKKEEKEEKEKRIINMAEYYVNNKSTIRSTAKHFGISKSSLFYYFKKHLKDISFNMYCEVRKIADNNTETRALKGGMATKKMYEERRKNKDMNEKKNTIEEENIVKEELNILNEKVDVNYED